MKYAVLCFLLLIGVASSLQAQDKLVLRTGKTIEVTVRRSTDTDVYYTYPGETSVYERPKSAISYIIYADGRKEIFDENLRNSERNTSGRATGRTESSTNRNQLIDDDIFWQDVKTTFAESEVKGMTRLQRITAISSVSYRDAIQQLKKQAAEIGGTTVLVMDIPENDDIEVMGIVYRDETMEYVPRNANERNNVPAESPSNARRKQIAQQMESYNDESNLEFDDYSDTPRNNSRANTQPARNNASQSRQSNTANAEPDAVYLTNGRVIKGVIEEYDPDDFVSIRTSNGRVHELSMDDVRRVSQVSSRNNNRQSPSARNANVSPSRANTRYDNNDRYNNNNRNASRTNDDYYDDYSVSGYKGIFDVGYHLPIGGIAEKKGTLEINTSHGYQINEYLFVGAGLGLHIYSARDMEMKIPGTYPYYASGSIVNGIVRPSADTVYMRAIDSSYMSLPIFLDIRGYLPLQNNKLTPFFMLRFGYAFNLSDSFGGMGLYINPAIGLKFQLSPMIGLNFSLGYSRQQYGGIPKEGGYGYYYYKDDIPNANTGRLQMYNATAIQAISLKLGVEF